MLQGHSRRQNENEDNRRVSSWPQSTTSESMAVNMTKQIEMRAIGKATEMARRSLWRPTYIPIRTYIPMNFQRWQIRLAHHDVTSGGAWRNRVVAKQEDSHSTAPADK